MNERPTEPMPKYGTITANHAPNHMITWTLRAGRLTSVLTAARLNTQQFLTNFYQEKITDNKIRIREHTMHILRINSGLKISGRPLQYFALTDAHAVFGKVKVEPMRDVSCH